MEGAQKIMLDQKKYLAIKNTVIRPVKPPAIVTIKRRTM
jgi:hypothetical protein